MSERPAEHDFERRHRGQRLPELACSTVPAQWTSPRVVIQKQADLIQGIVRDDFLVNDDATGGCLQWTPSVSSDADGDYVVCWGDDRSGEFDIYAQRYDSSGSALGVNFRVNDDLDQGDQFLPAVAMRNVSPRNRVRLCSPGKMREEARAGTSMLRS